MKNITVIGSGTMGNGIAHVFAQHNFKVNLVDISQDALDRAIATITKNLDRMVAKGSISEDVKEQTLKNLSTYTDLHAGAKEAELVVEAATENPEVKFKLFRDLDAICKPETILASNTSSISITKIAAQTKRANKVIGMHFMNPVPVMKLIEVIRGYSTDNATTKAIMELSVQLNKIPPRLMIIQVLLQIVF